MINCFCLSVCEGEESAKSQHYRGWEEQRLSHHPIKGTAFGPQMSGGLQPVLIAQNQNPQSSSRSIYTEENIIKLLITHPLVPGLWA